MKREVRQPERMRLRSDSFVAPRIKDQTALIQHAAGAPPPAPLLKTWERLPKLVSNLARANDAFAAARLFLLSDLRDVFGAGLATEGAKQMQHIIFDATIISLCRLLDTGKDSASNVRGLSNSLSKPGVKEYLAAAFQRMGPEEEARFSEAQVLRQAAHNHLSHETKVLERIMHLRTTLIAHSLDDDRRLQVLHSTEVRQAALRTSALGAAVFQMATGSKPQFLAAHRESFRKFRAVIDPAFR